MLAILYTNIDKPETKMIMFNTTQDNVTRLEPKGGIHTILHTPMNNIHMT